MKSKNSNLLTWISSLSIACSISATAADVIKANNADNLNLNSSWALGGLPTTADYATWDATVLDPNVVNLGGNLTWGGIKITSPSGPVTINAGSTLTLSGGVGTTTISMGTATQNLTLNNNVTLGANQTWNAGAGIAIVANGIVGESAAFRLTKNGTGTLDLTNASNSYTGGTTVSAGTLSFVNGALGTTGTITVSGGRLLWAAGNTQDISSRLTQASGVDTGGNNVTFASAISGTTLIKYGAGTLTLSNTNTFTGATTVQGGTLKLDYSADGSKLSNTAALTLKGATLELAGTVAHTEVVNNTVLYSDTSGYGGRANTVSRSGGSSILQMNALTRSVTQGGATINFEQANIATTDTLNTNSILGGWATVGGENWAINSTDTADGEITAYTGYTTTTAGGNTAASYANKHITVDSSPSTMDAVISAYTLRFNDAAARTLTLFNTGNNVLSSGGILVTNNVGNNASLITGGTLTATGGSDLVIHQHNLDNALTINSAIANNGTGVALTKAGAGTLIVDTAGTWTGGTFVNAGVLRLKAATQNTTIVNGTGGRVYVAQGAAIEFDNGTTGGTAHALQLAGTGINNTGAIRNITGNNTAGGGISLYDDTRINSDAGTLTLSGSVTNSASWNSRLYVGGAGNVTMSNNVTGGLALIKDGSGTLLLSGTANTYTGGTTISNGTLEVAAIGRLSTGLVTLDGGKLKYSGATASANKALTLNNAAGNAIEVSSLAATFTLSGVIDGAGGFNKTGTGTLELTRANTYTGKTTVSEGTLKLSGAGSIAASTTIEVKPGATLDASGGYTLGATQTLGGAGTVIGTMTVAGTLSPGSSPGTLTTGSEVWSDGGDYNWQVNDASGAAGSGYDTIAVNGTLDLSGLTTNGFSLNLWTLAGISPDANGDAINFNNASDYAWTILSTTGGLLNFEASDFSLNTGASNGTSGFSNDLAGGAFSLSTSGDNKDLILKFTAAAVPEPSSMILGGLGALALFRRRRQS